MSSCGEKGRFENQIQFVVDQIDVMSFVKGDYGNIPANGVGVNKANRSQFDANEPVRGEIARALRASQ
jgi:hypothetical protein